MGAPIGRLLCQISRVTHMRLWLGRLTGRTKRVVLHRIVWCKKNPQKWHTCKKLNSWPPIHERVRQTTRTDGFWWLIGNGDRSDFENYEQFWNSEHFLNNVTNFCNSKHFLKIMIIFQNMNTFFVIPNIFSKILNIFWKHEQFWNPKRFLKSKKIQKNMNKFWKYEQSLKPWSFFWKIMNSFCNSIFQSFWTIF